jgi:cell division protein FtsI/penicillin-binding protein 2
MRRVLRLIRLNDFCKGLALLFAAIGFSSNLYAAESFQAFVSRLMQGKSGAVIVSDPRNGQILALTNPQTAFHEAYTPGSVVKTMVSAAALEEGVITPTDRIVCRRVPRLLGEAYHCTHPPPAQPYNLSDALANSCNYFFSELSTRLSSSALTHWYGIFGFGAAGENSFPGEVQIPDKPKGKAIAVLGEQGVTVTPAQVLMAYSTIAMHGQMFQLILPAQHKAPSLDSVITLRDGTYSVLSEGLRGCVDHGSCRAAAVPGVSVAGKTGTAAAIDGSRVTHAWFVGYAPARKPEVAIVIFLKRGTGGANAAPLAAQILKRYFAQKPNTP